MMHMHIPVPPGRSLLPFQEKGVRYMLSGRNTLVADEMGLGKSIEAIAFCNVLAVQGNAGITATGQVVQPLNEQTNGNASITQSHLRVLIVAPASLLLNWNNELNDWCTFEMMGNVIIASYNAIDDWALFSREWDVVIFDEAHYIKNPASQRFQNAERICKRAKRILMLTGTPLDRSPIDAWPLLKILDPATWDPPRKDERFTLQPTRRKSHIDEGLNFWDYAKRYCGLDYETYQRAGRQRKALAFDKGTNLEEFNDKLRKSCMLRRLKKNVLKELPPKRRKIVVLENRIKKLDTACEERTKELLFRLGVADITYDNYEAVVKKLVADKVALKYWSETRHEQARQKLPVCIEYIEDQLDASHKIIVFAHHRDIVERLYLHFKDKPYNAVCVTGATHPADRQVAVERFQKTDYTRLFIGSLSAAGVGFTLTAASHEIFVELSPSPMQMNQCEDRAHRIGQEEMVLVEHLVLNHTLCARMAKILVRKQSIINAALDCVQTDPELRVESDNDV